MAAPFRLVRGDPAPRQQTPTTCGSACLAVARMLANPPLADWIRHGDPDRTGSESPEDRFAAYEQVVAGRTNGLVGADGRLQPPWPRALGTPPWGARGEVERGVAPTPCRYRTTWFRFVARRRLEQVHGELQRRTTESGPALLYVGSSSLPRHVVLVLPPSADLDPDVYEPSTGHVVGLPREPFVTRRLGLAGWDVPWCAVWPAGGH
ncbi:hypothetical protein [Intrasporangium sp.]|uniref:hypothetical protein n=1 Tax=Intrasporangium sp. TaxID=1925024 RepID=UPI00322149F8